MFTEAVRCKGTAGPVGALGTVRGDVRMRSAFTNTFKTTLLLAFLGALFIGIGALFGQGGLIIGVVLGLVFVGGSFWFSDKIAVAAARAKPVSREDAPRLYEIVEELGGTQQR